MSGAPDTPAFSYVVVSTILGVAWLGVLVLNRCYDSSLVGRGSEEFRRVAASSAQLWAVVAIGCYVAKIELARSFVAVAFPVGLLLLFIARWTARRWLRVVRERTGTWSHRVLVLGDRAHAEDLVARLQHSTASGYQVVGVCVPGGAPAEDVHGVTVVGSLTQATIAIDATGADTVAVTAVAGLTAQVLKRLSWELASRDIDMVVAPGLVDVAGPRIHIQPVDGLPLLHIAQPELTGPRKALKGGFDRLFALVLTVLLLPVLVAVAVVVRLSGPGPVLFKQRRIGLDGEPFTCYKFRTMVVDAEARLRGADDVRRRTDPVQDDQRSAGDPGRKDAAPLLPRRAASAAQRADRRHEPGRAPAAGPERGRPVHLGVPTPAARQAGTDRPVAGQRPVRPLVRGERTPRPLLRRELVARHRPDDSLAHLPRGRQEQRRLLMDSSATRWTKRWSIRWLAAVGAFAAAAGLLSAHAPLWLIGALVLPLAHGGFVAQQLGSAPFSSAHLRCVRAARALSLGKPAYFVLFAACFVTSLVRVLPRLRDDRWDAIPCAPMGQRAVWDLLGS